jgi:lipopolysaccharide export system permease protein
MQYLWLHIDELVSKGLAWSTILKFLGWVSSFNIPMSLPLSTLLASLMTMGNLGENNELLAIKASGISLNKILQPLYYTIIVVAIGSFFLSSNFVPYAFLQMRTMLQEIRNKSPELSIPEDIFYDEIGGFSMRVDRKDPLTGALINVMIYDHTKGEGNIAVTIADTGYVKQTKDSRYILFKLINGTTYSEELKNNRLDKTTYPFNRRFFKEQTVAIDMGEEESRSYSALFKEMPMAKSMVTLNSDSDSINKKRKNIINNFEQTNLNTSSSFKYSLKEDTLRQKTKSLKYNIDSIFNASTATLKVDYLAQAESGAIRAIGYWDNELRDIQLETRKLKNIDYERYRKYTMAFACIIFFFIGAPLGAIIRKGGLGLPVVVSIFFFVIYWVIETICRKMVQNGDWEPFFGAWFSSFIFMPMAVFLTYKANTDSQLFNPDSYKRLFNILLGRMKQLMNPIDFDKITPLYGEQLKAAYLNSNEEAKQMETLIDNYLSSHRLSKLFQSRKSMLKMNDNSDLLEIQSLYDHLLSFYAAIEDEKIRNIVKDFPVLNPDEFILPQFLFNQNGLLKIPYTVILIIVKIRKFKKLEYILKEIKNNLDLNNYINDRSKI